MRWVTGREHSLVIQGGLPLKRGKEVNLAKHGD